MFYIKSAIPTKVTKIATIPRNGTYDTSWNTFGNPIRRSPDIISKIRITHIEYAI